MLSVIIPTYKDKVISAEIGPIFTDMQLDVQVIISTDEEPHIGKGNAIKEGLKIATGEYILFMDADLQIPPTELKQFMKAMELYEADVVIGNKHHSYSNIEYTLWRKFVSLGYQTFVQLLFHLPYKDTQCGFKLFKREPLLLTIDKVLNNRFSFDLELILALRENGFRIVEAPVYVKRQTNRGSVNLRSVVEMFIDTLQIWYRKHLGWYKV